VAYTLPKDLIETVGGISDCIGADHDEDPAYIKYNNMLVHRKPQRTLR